MLRMYPSSCDQSMRSYRVSESTSTATATTASVTVSGGSQPESAIERHHQGSFTGLPTTTVHAPESTHIPIAEQSFSGLKLLAEVSTSQAEPFETFATHRAITFDDEDQEQTVSSLSLPDEPSQAADDANPIMEVEEPHGLRFIGLPDNNSKDTKIKTTIGVRKSKIPPSIKEHIPLAMSGTALETVQTAITEGPKLPSDQNLAIQDSDSTDKWIMYSGDKTSPFQCGYEGCGKTYTSKHNLKKHFALHIGESQFRCYPGNCAGAIKYRDSQALARHIHRVHTMERPFECNICNKRFGRLGNLNRHQQNTHSTEKEQTTKIVQKSPPKRKRKVDPFEALATHRTITFDDENQEQSASSLSLPDEPSQAADDANPIIEVEEPHELRFTVLPDSNSKDTKIRIAIDVPKRKITPSIKEHFRPAVLGTVPETVQTGITEDPKLPSDQNLAIQGTDSTDKWIIYSGDRTKPFKCSYEGCSKTYITKQSLLSHFVSHIGGLRFRCYTGDCTGARRYSDRQALTRHIRKKHTMIRPFECNICNRRFGRSDHLKRHQQEVHSTEKEQTTKKEQKSPPKRMVYPLDALARHRIFTFDDKAREQSAGSLSLFYEPSQATDDANRIIVDAESHKTGTSENPKRPSDQNLADQNTDSTEKWIMYSGDKTKPFKCNYKGCGKIYSAKQNLQRHFASHIGDSQFRCYFGDCAGAVRYRDRQALARHIHKKHTMERPFECNFCNKRFGCRAHLKRHKKKVHSTEKK